MDSVQLVPPPVVNWKKNLFVIWLSQFLAMVGFGCCMPFIPLLLKENLHIENDKLVGIYTSIYYLASMLSLCVATSVWGILADRFGRKIMLLRASYAAAIFYPMLAFAPNFWVLASIRFVCSFFSGTVNPAQTLLIATTPKEKHGFVLGVLSTGVSSGNMLGYLLGGIIVDRFGYTTGFLSCGAIYMVSALLVHIFAKDDFSVALAKKQRQTNKFKFKDVATPAVLWMMVMFLLIGISTRLIQPYMAMLVKEVHGLKGAAFWTGIVSSASSVGGFLSGLCLGWLCDRFAPRKLLLPLLIVGGVFTAAMAYSFDIAMLIVTKFFAAFAGGGIKPVLQLMLTKLTRPELRGTYFGWSGSLNTAGGIVCSLLGGSLFLFTDVRGVYMAAALILLIMIPLMIPMVLAIRKEYFSNPENKGKKLEI